MNSKQTFEVLNRIKDNLITIIPFPVEIIEQEEMGMELRVCYGDNSTVIFFGFNNNGTYYNNKFYSTYSERKGGCEYIEYKGNDYSVEALTEYTVDMINSCTAKVC